MRTEKIQKLEKALALLVEAYAAAEHVDSDCTSAISSAEDTVQKAIAFYEDKDLDEYEARLQLRLEKMAENSKIKKTILNEVELMSIHDFQNAVDESGISGNTVVDELVENLVDYLFKQKIGD